MKIWMKSASIAGQVSDILTSWISCNTMNHRTGAYRYLLTGLNISRVFCPESSSRKTSLKMGGELNCCIFTG
jgi:hypothetical protein